MKCLNILIADDEEMLRDIYEIVLEGNFTCKLIKACDGQEAIDIINSGIVFDLIITDYNMPILNGGAVYAFNKSNANIPIIVLSGGEIQDYIELTDFKTSNPRNQFITKPFDDTDLVLAVNLALTTKSVVAAPVISDEFIKVQLKHYIKYAKSSSEVYLSLHEGKFTKIMDYEHTASSDKSLLQRYIDKNVEYVFIKREHYLNLIIESISELKQHLISKAPATELIKIAGLQFHVSISGLNSIGITTIQIELVSSVIEETIQEIMKDSIANLNLKKICEEEGFLIGHSILIMLIAGSLCKETQLNFAATMKRICLAAFFHDFSLIDSDIAALELNIHRIEDEKIFQKVLSHPIESANYLPALKEIIDDTKRIILEHHEMPNGDGYPKKLSSNQIAPLSCLFILSQQMVFCLLRNDFDNTRLKDFIRNNEIIFKQGNFTKFYNIASKNFG